MKPSRQADLPASPFELVKDWFERAKACEDILRPNAMCLSTTSPDGQPEARFVMVDEASEGGFVFLTDTRSPKVASMTANPRVALTVYWGADLNLQIRATGESVVASEGIADAIFEARARRAQLAAWVHPQSQVVSDREQLETEMAGVESRFEDSSSIPRPPTCRAYRVVPDRVEFWIERVRGLHDRFLYEKTIDGEWSRCRVAP